jgi:ubiquinol-cytochrome c reductase cytochrome c1 subunit
MKKLIFGLLIAALPGLVLAAGAGAHLDDANVDVSDKASLQRGAGMYFNYCAGCHSLKYMRYNRLAEDLGLSEEQVMNNLMLVDGKIGDTIQIAMPADAAASWFGVQPPDLSLIARAKKNGPDWLYTYLRSFYLDASRPLGVNNIVFPDVGMPHVLWELQGWQEAKFDIVTDEQGNQHEEFAGFELVKPGSMSPDEYDSAMRDLVNFLTYVGEPGQMARQSLGWKVLLFLALFFVVALLLKKEYWKDIH